MHHFAIRNIETGKYVAAKGHKNSYVSSLQAKALQTYTTREAAEANKCGNETVVTIVRGDAQ